MPRDAAALVVDGEPRRASSCIRTRCAPTTSIIPTSCASISIPVPGVEWPQLRRGGARRARDARRPRAASAGRRRRARAACTSTCASSGAGRSTQVRRAALALAREVERRAPDARDAASGGRRSATASSSTTTRTPRTAPSPRLLGAADARRARVGAADVGRGRRLRSRGLHAGARCRRGSPSVGDRHAGIDDAPGSLDALLELSARQEAEGLGDAPWPPHYRKQDGRAAARRAVDDGRPRAPALNAAAAACPPSRSSRSPRRAQKADALAGLERWKARHPEAAAHLRAGRRPRRRDARPLDRPGRASAINLRTCPRASARQKIRSIPTTIPGPRRRTADYGRARRKRGRARRRRDFELIVAAVRAAACRDASAGRSRRGGSGRPAGGRTSTSQTRSIRSGSHDRSLPALQRLWPPGIRVISPLVGLGPLAPRMIARARRSRSGVELRRRAACAPPS